jgi:hypothetical protein
MNNAGIAKPDPTGTTRRSIVWLAVLTLFVVGAAALILQFFPILYGIFFPPLPPLPANATVLEHRNLSYGLDEWNYTAQQTPCEVIQFYQSQGGLCNFSCEAASGGTSLLPPSQVTECSGAIAFSQFKLRWIVNIGVTNPNSTDFRLSREIFWGGEIPPRMEELVEQIEATNAATTPAAATNPPQ